MSVLRAVSVHWRAVVVGDIAADSMADTLVGDVEITSDGHGCGDVEPVVMPFEVVFEALGQRDAVIFHGQPVAFGGHVRQRLVLAGYEGAAAVRGR